MKKIILAFIGCILLNSFALAQNPWSQKANYSGGARNSAIAFTLNGKGYLGLGQNASGTKLYDFWEYDPSADSWKQKATYPGAGSFAASAFTSNGKGYVCFGASSTGAAQGDLWEYNPSTDSWTKKANFPGTTRYGASWFVLNDTAFIIGGSSGGSPYLSDVWMYISSTNTWSQKSNFSGGSRSHGAGFTIDGTGYFGTGIKNSTTATKDVWKYNKSKDTWTSISDIPSGAIIGTIGFEVEKRGFIGTGYNLSNYLKEIYEYLPSTNTWQKLDSLPSSQSARSGSVSYVINKSVYFGTGYQTSTTSLNDVWSFTPKSKCTAGITTQPKNQSISLNNTASFNAVSADNNASYKWQKNSGSGFTDISDGGQYSGSKTKNLSIAQVKYSTNNNHKFRCVASNATCADTSVSVTLTVVCTNLIKNEPSNINSSNGSEVKFTVAELFSPTVLQWQKDDGSGFKNLTNIGQFFGYDQDTLTVFNLSLSNNNTKFRCMASYGGCLDTSLTVTLTVYCKPIIKSHPSNKTIYKGNLAKIGVKAYDYGTTFQWQLKNGSTFQNLSDAGQFSGTTTDSLSISSVTLTNNKQEYRCILGYKSCSDTSKIAALTVLCNPIVNVSPGNQNKTEGEKATFTVSSFDSKTAYLWQSNLGTGFQTVNNAGQYSGANTNILNVSNVLLANDNQKFRCILSADGCFDTSKNATLRVTCKPLIAAQPSNKTAYVNSKTLFYVSSTDPSVTYIWQTDLGLGFQNLSNAGQYNGVNNDTLTIDNLSFSNNNQKFKCIITLGGCTETTEIVSLLVSCKPIIAIQPKNKSAVIMGSAFFNVSTTIPSAIYRWQIDIGLGFQNLSNAGQFKGVNDDTLHINNLTIANDNQTFRCLINNGACSDTTVSVSLTVKLVSIKEEIKTKGLIIYPNPSSDFIIIKISPYLLNNSYSIIDQQGRVIACGSLIENITKVNIENLAKGVYIFQTEPEITRKIFLKQ